MLLLAAVFLTLLGIDSQMRMNRFTKHDLLLSLLKLVLQLIMDLLLLCLVINLLMLWLVMN